MTRRLIKGGSRFEDIASFSRAVVDGDMIYLSGTTGHYQETGAFPEDTVEQAELAISHIEAALAEAGATLADVLRVVVYLADRIDLMSVCEVVGRKFADIRPANTTVIATLALPEMKVEIEVTARRGSAG